MEAPKNTTASLHIEEMLWRLLVNERERAERYRQQRDKAQSRLRSYQATGAAKRISRELVEKGKGLR